MPKTPPFKQGLTNKQRKRNVLRSFTNSTSKEFTSFRCMHEAPLECSRTHPCGEWYGLVLLLFNWKMMMMIHYERMLMMMMIKMNT